jgi:hypothetical protein
MGRQEGRGVEVYPRHLRGGVSGEAAARKADIGARLPDVTREDWRATKKQQGQA